MQLEYLNSDLPKPVLLTYGDDSQGAAMLRRAAEELASGDSDQEVRVDRLSGFSRRVGRHG